jgi:hypothetical protein
VLFASTLVMAMTTWLPFLLVVPLLSTSLADGNGDPFGAEPLDKSHWVDPWDMGEPEQNNKAKPKDTGSMKDKFDMLKSGGSGGGEWGRDVVAVSMMDKIAECSSCADSDRRLRECRDKFKKLKEKRARRSNNGTEEAANQETTTPRTGPTPDDLFLLRHVRYLVQLFGLADHSAKGATNNAVKYSTVAHFSPEDVATLVAFAREAPTLSERKRRSRLAEVDAVLSHYMEEVEPYGVDGKDVGAGRDYTSAIRGGFTSSKVLSNVSRPVSKSRV